MSEAYDSDSESSSSVSPSTIKKEAIVNESLGDESDDEEREEEEEVLDWDSVVAKLRLSINDRSSKKRAAFIHRYLTVSENCGFYESLGRRNTDGVAPPFSHVPGIFTTLLSTLPTLPLPDHIEQVVDVLMNLVKRDEKLADGAEGKFKLGDKLVKWTSVEAEKASTGAKM